jgi:hypothetical protein
MFILFSLFPFLVIYTIFISFAKKQSWEAMKNKRSQDGIAESCGIDKNMIQLSNMQWLF